MHQRTPREQCQQQGELEPLAVPVVLTDDAPEVREADDAEPEELAPEEAEAPLVAEAEPDEAVLVAEPSSV
jgi:hypothetical protein